MYMYVLQLILGNALLYLLGNKMKIFYIITQSKRPYCIGSVNKHKMRMMYPGFQIFSSDISEFKGHLLSSEYID
jgi:hypothetical protein